MKQPPKVLQILYPGLGGHGSVVFSLLRAAGKQVNFRSHLIFYGIEMARQEYINECQALRINCDSVLKKPGLDLASLKKILAILRREKPDLIFLHSVNLIPTVFVARFFFRTKIVAVEHQSNQLKTKKDWFFSSLCLLLAYKVIYLSEDYKDEIKSKLRLFFRRGKVRVIPNGIDINYFRPSESERTIVTRFGMISRINSLKDHKTLINAFSSLSDIHPVELIIAGDGPELPVLKVLVENLHLSQKVKFTGLLEGNQILQFFHDIDIYVHCSFGETMSTAVMQAMACGLPVIASDVKGINNMLRDQITALLVPVEDVEMLAGAMKMLLTDHLKRKGLSIASRSYAEQYFSNERMFNQYRNLIEN